MTTKTLYILISDGGDGSYYPQYTMNSELIDKLQRAYNEGYMHYENGIGCDGDGFHYETLTLPDDVTYESLGIRQPLDEDYADQFFEEEDEE